MLQKNRRKVREFGCVRDFNHEMRNCENGGVEIEDI